MKITLIREEKESGKETVSTCEADALLEKIKTETKAAHVTALRTMLLYTPLMPVATTSTSTSCHASIRLLNTEEAATAAGR